MGGCCKRNCCIMDNPVGDFFRDLFCVDSGCGYTPRCSTTDDHAKKIADELAKMKENYAESAKISEEKIMDRITGSMDIFVEELEELNKSRYGGKSLNIDIASIKRKNKKLRNKVVGHIGRVMDERLVQTDPELSVILEEKDDKKREKNFKAFCESVFDEAKISLKTPIEDSINEQKSIIENEINQRINEVTNSITNMTVTLTKLNGQKDQNNSAYEKTLLNSMYYSGIIDCILDETFE